MAQATNSEIPAASMVARRDGSTPSRSTLTPVTSMAATRASASPARAAFTYRMTSLSRAPSWWHSYYGSGVVTHPEKVLFPDSGITKGELCSYYEAIAPLMLPHITGRPVTMERYPAGIGAKGFIQKDVSKGFPDWLERV